MTRILGEEGGSTGGTSGLTWVVDPIDGTVNYLYGIPHYAVSIAVVEGEPDPLTWEAVAGCVANPATGETFTAARGEGAFLGTHGIRVAPPVPLAEALIATGFAYASETRGVQGELVARLLPRIRDIRRQGTASLDLCFVAAGRYNAFFERTLSPWDHAAGALIAREAGALVTGRDGAAPSSDFLLAGEPERGSRPRRTSQRARVIIALHPERRKLPGWRIRCQFVNIGEFATLTPRRRGDRQPVPSPGSPWRRTALNAYRELVRSLLSTGDGGHR